MNAESESGDQPTILGEYEVLKSIRKGKFATVYRAKKIGSDHIVALKRIFIDMMDNKVLEKTLKEVRLLKRLDHPNIVRFMDSFIQTANPPSFLPPSRPPTHSTTPL